MMKQESKPRVCDKCFKEANKLSGTFGGNMYCDNCYVPERDQPDFSYIPVGKTSGRIKIPEDICGICGGHLIQPTPVGIWTHGQDAEHDSVQHGDRDHSPRKATVLELLLLENYREYRRGGAINYYEYYGDHNAVHKDRHLQCLIHRKYWLKVRGTPNDIKLVHNNHGFGIDETIREFMLYGERPNRKKFLKFLKDGRVRITKNPKSSPTTGDSG